MDFTDCMDCMDCTEWMDCMDYVDCMYVLHVFDCCCEPELTVNSWLLNSQLHPLKELHREFATHLELH